VFEGPSSRLIAEALGDGRGRVESVVLPHSYRHLSPWLTTRILFLTIRPQMHPGVGNLVRTKRRKVKPCANETPRRQMTPEVNVAGDDGLRREPEGGTTGPHALNPGPQPFPRTRH
jgi:hypothetical protein